MDMFSGWPFYRPGGDPGYGCYGPGCHPSRGQNFYGYPPSDPFFSDPEWYPEVSHFPFHRPSRRCSPFTRRSHNPFENRCDVHTDQPARPNKATRSDIEPEAANKVSTSPPSSTASASDKISLTQETTDDANAPTVEQAMEMHNQEVEGVKSEELKVDTVPPEVKRIEEIMKNSGELEEKVAAYTGVLGSKEYIYIEESLVAILLQLDKVETNGNMEIRKSRKSAVCKIQHVLTELESKAKSNMATAELSNKAEAMATDEVMSPATTAGKDNSEESTTNDSSTTNDGTMDTGEEEATNTFSVKQLPTTTTTGDNNEDEGRGTIKPLTEEQDNTTVTDKGTQHASLEGPSLPIGEDHSEAANDQNSSTDDDEAVLNSGVAEGKVKQPPLTLDSEESAMMTGEDDISVVENELTSSSTESIDCTVNEDTQCDSTVSIGTERSTAS